MKTPILKPTKVTVTKHDIKKGIPDEPDSCPIYWALVRALGKKITKQLEFNVTSPDIEVSPIDEYFSLTLFTTCFRMPKKAQKFVRDFDAGYPVKPFSFIAFRKVAA